LKVSGLSKVARCAVTIPTEVLKKTPKEKPAQLMARAGLLALAGMFNVPRKLIQIGTGLSVRVLAKRVNPSGEAGCRDDR
jgi:hypothetical protein